MSCIRSYAIRSLALYLAELVNICRTPLINLEDVFLTGLCANEQLGLQLTHNEVRPVEVTNQTKSDNTFSEIHTTRANIR